jgi:crotonobetainyl-CoA:carnitine CoA-transferase CaiB-like acyl-CoA transferase
MGEQSLMTEPRGKTLESRQQAEHARAILDRVRAWASTLDRADIEAAAATHGFAAAGVATAKDKYEDEHLRTRGSVWEYEDPLYGRMVEHGPGPKLSHTPARIKWAAKPVGWHNHEVFTRLLGLSPSRLKTLTEHKVIGQWADIPGAKPPAEWTPEQGRV